MTNATRVDRDVDRDAFRSRILRLLPNPEIAEDERAGRQRLLETIDEKIIPQLLLAHCTTLEPEIPDPTVLPTESDVADFAARALTDDISAAMESVDAITTKGCPLEGILLSLIAPAARLLGVRWEEDELSFTEVTIGLTVMHQVVHTLSIELVPRIAPRGAVVLVAAAHEGHTLGLHVLGDFFRKAGWSVMVDPTMSETDLLDLVANERIEMIGISVSNSDYLQPLKRRIAELRKASRNPHLAVMLGGSLVTPETDDVADIFSNDPREAVRWLERYVREKRDDV